MKFLDQIDLMPWNEYLILISIFFGIVNLVAWLMLWNKKNKIQKQTSSLAEKLVSELNKEVK